MLKRLNFINGASCSKLQRYVDTYRAPAAVRKTLVGQLRQSFLLSVFSERQKFAIGTQCNDLEVKGIGIVSRRSRSLRRREPRSLLYNRRTFYA